MNAIILLALKDLLLLWRDKAAMFWVLIFPLTMALFFGSIFSGGGRTAAMSIAVIDTDQSENSKLFVEELKNSPALKVIELAEDSARYLVRQGKLTGYVLIKTGFGETNFFHNDSTAGIEIGIDPARKAEAGYLQGLITQASFKPMQETFARPDRAKKMIDQQMSGLTDEVLTENPELKHLKSMYSGLDKFMSEVDTATLNSNSPMQGPNIKVVEVTTIAERPKSSWEITFPQALLWALVGCASSFAVSMVVERTRGTFLRLRLAPISKMQILTGKGLACFIACVTVMAVLLTLGITIFGVRIGNPWILIAAILASAICFVGIMMTASVLGKTEQAVGGSSMAILLIFSMTGGGMIPLLFMPSWMQKVSNASPAKWSILACEGAIWRGFTFSEMLLPLAVLTLIGVMGFIVGVTILSNAYD